MPSFIPAGLKPFLQGIGIALALVALVVLLLPWVIKFGEWYFPWVAGL